jgi:hypothetical protein
MRVFFFFFCQIALIEVSSIQYIYRIDMDLWSMCIFKVQVRIHYKKKKQIFTTCSSPRVRSLYTWRTVGHVQVATQIHVVDPVDTNCTVGHVYFNTRGQLTTCIKIHVATVGRVYFNTCGHVRHVYFTRSE